MYVKVTVTAEDEETASDVTVLPVEEASGQIEITSATVKKADQIEVTLAEAVDADDTVITLTKGTDEFTVTPKWADTNDSVTLTTAAKLVEGTYTVTLTSIEDETNTDYAEVEVEKQKVARIEILNDVALTNKAKNEAYAYYDVYDQYDESIRSSASVTWAGSCQVTANKANGQLKLTKNKATETWVYGDKIYLTGVYTKTGEATSKELTVGTEQNLDSIELVGFVKKGTSDIIPAKDGLPAGFKNGEYYMLFNAFDQNGNDLAADNIDENDVTFLSSDPLIIKELRAFKEGGLTVLGEEYCAVEVTPGIKVADGGEVTVGAVANKTGNKTEVNFVVGEDPVVAKFVLNAPTVTVADGDTVEIPFEAVDEKGKAIENFRTIAKQETFNTVTFSASEGHLVLSEQDNGKAILKWYDDSKYNGFGTNGFTDPDLWGGWALSQTTDGIDRPIILTVIVVGGESDNERIDVQDKRRPNAIEEVKMDEVYVEGGAITLTNTTSFKFLDQYGKTITGTDADEEYGDSTGFFTAAYADGDYDVLKGTGFAGYAFGVRVKNAGSGAITTADAAQATAIDEKGTSFVIEDGKSIKFATATNIQSAATGEGFKFEIAKIDTDNDDLDMTDASDWESVERAKFVGVAVVDITAVKSLTIGSLATFYVGSLDVTGDKIVKDGTALKDASLSVNHEGPNAGIYVAGSDYDQKVKVTGTYNGKTVTIPAKYYVIEANKLTTAEVATAGALQVVEARTFDEIIPATITDGKNANGGLEAADLYDKTTAKGTAKLAEDEVTATVYKLYSNDPDTLGDPLTSVELYDTAKTAITLSDQAPYAAEISGLAESYTFTPTLTNITNPNIKAKLVKVKVLDQYGVKFADTVDYTVTDIEESAAGYAENNFSVADNGSNKAAIEGAERGDTFTLVVSFGTLKESTAVTVGADTLATIVDGTNVYRDTLIYGTGGLEEQRLAGLK